MSRTGGCKSSELLEIEQRQYGIVAVKKLLAYLTKLCSPYLLNHLR